ncbi:MAG: beta-N-acetylhexosaminidase [Magnetococcales bacterium]|nr:beta-N-acetylhexosaminidase [Magnetococcales bacterium]
MSRKKNPAKHLVLGIGGTALSKQEKQWLETNRPEGIILFSRNIENIEQIKELVKSIAAISTPPPTIWIDQEGGRVQRIRSGFTKFPSPYRFTELFRKNRESALEMARLGGNVCGRELAEVGIGVNCAPVIDIRQNRADPVIGDRAFGNTPDEVIQLAGAWIDGLAATGVMAIGKHFPGHGAAQVDSHKDLPTITKSRQQLDDHELLPFKKLAPKLPAFMTAHLIAQAIDPINPATWSSVTLKKFLRKQWGYRGLIVSDAVEMGALKGDLADRVHNSLLAGCDLVLCCTGNLDDNQAALQGAIRAVEHMDEQESNSSVARISRILTPYRQPSKSGISDKEYKIARNRLEAMGENTLNNDPTEVG